MERMEDYAWTREPILKPIEGYLKSPNTTENNITSLFERYTKDSSKIERQFFISVLKDLNVGMIPQMIENFADQLLLPESQFVDLSAFYNIYHHFTSKQPLHSVNQSLQGPLSASVSFDGKKRTLDCLVRYMKMKKLGSLSDFMQIDFESGTRVVSVESLNDFLCTNCPELSHSEKESFYNVYRLKDKPELLNLETMQGAITDAMTPKTLDDFMEETRATAIRSGGNLGDLMPRNTPLSSSQFEDVLKGLGLALATARADLFFSLLDKDKKGSVLPQEFIERLEEYSIKNSDVNKNHNLFGIISKIRQAVKNGEKPLHCTVRSKCTKDNNDLVVDAKDLRTILEEAGVNLSETEYMRLFDFLDPAETSKVFYERFFELVGYVQPLQSSVFGLSTSPKAVPRTLVPLLNALREYCEANKIALLAALKTHGIKSEIVERNDLHMAFQEICRGRITDMDIFNGLRQFKAVDGRVVLLDVSEYYKLFLETSPVVYTKEKVLRTVAEKADNLEIDLRDLLVKNDASADSTMKKEAFTDLLVDNLFLGSEVAAGLEDILNDYDRNNTGKVFYDVFLSDVKMYSTKSTVAKKQDFKKMIEDFARAAEERSINFRERFVEKDGSNKGTVPLEVFVGVLKAANLRQYNEIDLMNLGKNYASSMSSEVQYKIFVLELQQLVNKRIDPNAVKTNLQWASRILDDLAIALYTRRQDALVFFKSYKLKPSNNTVNALNFAQGLKSLGIKLTENELQQLARDLDVYADRSVSIQELNTNVQDRTKLVVHNKDLAVHKQIADYVKARSINMLKNLKKYDVYNAKEIPTYDFEKELRNIMGSTLSEIDYQYLSFKYEKTPGRISYEEFVQALDTENRFRLDIDTGMLKGEEVQLIDRLRDAIRDRDLRVAERLRTLDRAKVNVFQCEVLTKVFPEDMLSAKDYKTLVGIIDPRQTGSFHTETIYGLLWTSEDEEEFRDNSGHNVKVLNDKIGKFCKTKNVDIEQALVNLDYDKCGHITSDGIRAALREVGMPLSDRQSAALLYYQYLPTDSRHRKNYVALVNRIMGSNNIATRFPEIKVDEGEKRQVNFAEEQKKISQGPPPKQKLKRSQENLLRSMAKKLVDREQEVAGMFGELDTNGNKCLSPLLFFDVLTRAEVVLTPEESDELLGVEGLVDGDGMVHYDKFMELIDEYDKIIKEESKRVGKQRRPPEEVSLNEDSISYIMEQFRVLREYLTDRGVNLEAVFSEKQEKGYLSFDTFCDILEDNNVDELAPEVADIFYSYLKEEPEGKVSYQRLLATLINGRKLQSYRQEEGRRQEFRSQIMLTGLQVRRLAGYMKEKDVPLKEFVRYGRGRVISKEELRMCLDDIKYTFTDAELDSLFRNIALKSNEEGCLPHLLWLINQELSKEFLERKPKLEQRHLDTIEGINKELAAKKISYNSFYKALDSSGDGYADANQFVAGITSKLALSIPASPLDELFEALDLNK